MTSDVRIPRKLAYEIVENESHIVAAIEFCAGTPTEHLTAATEAGVTLDSVLGALREAMPLIERAATEEKRANRAPTGMHPRTERFDQYNMARAILAHFPNKGTDDE